MVFVFFTDGLPRVNRPFCSHRGMGLFVVLVAVILGSLSVMGIHNYLFVSRTNQDVAWVTFGDQAMIFAKSAIEEAVFAFSMDVNDLSSTIFTDFRDLAKTRDLLFFEIPVSRTQALIEASDGPVFELEGGKVQVRVVLQNAYKDLYYEKFGTIEFFAVVRVKAGFSTVIKREARLLREFRMNLISVPRPFDQLTWYVKDLTGFLNPAEENKNIADSILYLTQILPESRRIMKKEIDDMQDIAGENLDKFRNMLNGEAFATTWPIPVNFPADLSLYSRQAEYGDLKALDLFGKIRAVNREIFQKFQQYEEAGTRTMEAIKSDIAAENQSASSVDAPMQEYATYSRELFDLHIKRLQIYTSFQELVDFASGAMKAKTDQFFAKFEDSAQWYEKASHYLDEGHQNVNQVFDWLLSKYDPLNGVIYVHNPGTTLRVSRSGFRGKLVVYATGNVRLENFEVSDLQRDLLTVIAKNITLSGVCQASVVALDQFRVVLPVQIQGNLILKKIVDSNQLQGVLTYDPRIYSGTTTQSSDANAKKGYYFVSVGPRVIGRHFNRVIE